MNLRQAGVTSEPKPQCGWSGRVERSAARACVWLTELSSSWLKEETRRMRSSSCARWDWLFWQDFSGLCAYETLVRANRVISCARRARRAAPRGDRFIVTQWRSVTDSLDYYYYDTAYYCHPVWCLIDAGRWLTRTEDLSLWACCYIWHIKIIYTRINELWEVFNVIS